MIKPNDKIFKNNEKEAEFWENNYKKTKSTGTPIKVIFAKDLSETINIRLDPQTPTLVRNKAKEKGLGPTQLIRMWIMEKIGKK